MAEVKTKEAFPFLAAFGFVGTLAETVGSIFTSGDKVKIAQTEVDKAKEGVRAIEAQGDIERTKLAEKALDVKIAQFNLIASQNKDSSSLAQTKTIGYIVIAIVFIGVLYLGYRLWINKKPNVVQQSPYYQYVPEVENYPRISEHQEVKALNVMPEMSLQKISG
jgi:hypothetical protein